jgi:hypothetical protein
VLLNELGAVLDFGLAVGEVGEEELLFGNLLMYFIVIDAL